jgi:uncharacterized protein HemX
MLPIARRKTMTIPHSLAAIAAAVCLGLAFVTDFKEREHNIRVQLAAPAQLEATLPAQDEALRDRAATTETPRKVKRERSGGGIGPLPLPWFPGHRNGH